MWGKQGEESPQAKIIDAVAKGEIDTAIVWGPLAGYFAKRYQDKLVVKPIASDPKAPSLVFAYDISLGVRQGEDAFKAELQDVLDRRRQDIYAILTDFGIPLVTVPPGSSALSEAH
jgi:ABC-type amino acid transport substrate-binding protein